MSETVRDPSQPARHFFLTGHHALVTGGGSGLGLGIARCFVAAGARVTLAGTNAQKLKKAAQEPDGGALHGF
ncbi:SDR family NAD(P)-dependent oxidoreductase [Bosea sp. PAMC 26642]|uniref:SDR family NAD(P)-dependent oxidoreductase n=1 Tax=Bosea sp. (strain PAMC 26642) TaxID=1792307 RepID=UPI000770092D|nr:SDR family NAD(P)-dependent oxidoreductase [Bosea sp. PAMC 26642]AMJ62775.1 hypothetical protein AXW83_22970 [Bosea sp. PAMC 26642]